MNGKRGKSRMGFLTVLAALLWAVAQPAAAAQESSPGSSFQGKMIRIVVGYTPGGGFDTFARLLARHLGRYIPGKPKVIVQNMPGAGSLVAANRVYAAQPGDGRTIVTFHYGMVTQALVGDPNVQFDPLKYLWLGDPTIGGLPEVLWVRSDLPIHTLEDLRKREEPLALGATGVGTGSAVAGEFLRYLGLPIKMVYGYRGSSAAMAALERKEADGRIQSQSTTQTIYRRFIEEGLVRPILAIGREPRLVPLRGVATLEDLKLNPDQRRLAEFLTTTFSLLRLYAVPPGTSPERVTVLQEAFLKSLRSQELLKDAGRQGVIVSPLSGEQVRRTIQRLFQTPPEILEQYKNFIGLK